MIQTIVAGSAGEEGNLKNALSKSFSTFKNGDNPGANVIRTAFQPEVYKMMDTIGLTDPNPPENEKSNPKPASTSVEEWLKSDPSASASSTVGELLNKIFGKDKIDNVLNKGELTPSEGQNKKKSAALSPEQEAEAEAQQAAMQQAAGQQNVDTQPQQPPMAAQAPQSQGPMSPNPAPSPPPVTFPMGLAASVLPVRPMGGIF